MEAQKFKVILVGIIFNPQNKKVLVGKNKEDKTHSFLEGDLKQGEDLDIGLKRVISQKTGYKVHNLGAVYANNALEDNEILELYFLCEATEGKEIPGENVEELRWIKPSEVEQTINKTLPSTLKEYIIGLG